jgi:hypothetical protein
VCKPGENDVFQEQGLPIDAFRNMRVGMAMNIDPPAADRVDVALSLVIE